MPYIVYLYNFFINGNNYTFGEILAGSRQNDFLVKIETRFMNYYETLITANSSVKNVSKLFSQPNKIIEIYGEDTLKNMFKTMLDPEKIRDYSEVMPKSGMIIRTLRTEVF